MKARPEMDPLCPACGGRTRVVLTLTETGSSMTVRRRCCLDCDHRFYTQQSEEVYVPKGKVVKYGSRSKRVCTLESA